MRNYLVGGLIVLNAMLIVAVGASLLQWPEARAQSVGLGGNYLMVNGSILGASNDVVYLVDLQTRQLSALYYDRTNQGVTRMGSRDLVRDLGVPAEQGMPRPGGPARRTPAPTRMR